MRTTHRHILLTILLTLCGTMLYAQERKVMNKPFIDERRLHYGFTIGIHDQGLDLAGNGFIDPETGNQWIAECDKQNFGFSVGVLGELKLTRYLALRAIPSLHFGSKHITFINRLTGKSETQDMKSTYIGVPANLKISAPRFNNYRPYLVTGMSFMYDLTAKKQTLIRTKPTNVFAELGLGCDFYLPFFKFIPELKFCLGLSDILQRKRPDLTEPSQMIYTNSIKSATPHMIVLSLYFE